MAPKESYLDSLKNEFNSLIDKLELIDLQKQFLRSRWLDQVIWMDGKADTNQRWYYNLRLISIIGGVIVPALISLNLGSENISIVIRLITFIISLIVAICVAIEQFFHYGDRWRHYRHNAERLKTEGWQFSQLSGPYGDFSKHKDAFRIFVARVEEIQQHEAELFICDIAKEKETAKDNSSSGPT
jgi:hypothetical protein